MIAIRGIETPCSPSQRHPALLLPGLAPVRSAFPPRAAEGGRSSQEPPRPAPLPPPLRPRSAASAQMGAVALLYFTEIYIPHPITTLTELSPFPCARSVVGFLSIPLLAPYSYITSINPSTTGGSWSTLIPSERQPHH